MKILYRSLAKTKTNNGDLAKQYFIVMKNDKDQHALIIHKYVLSDDTDLYEGDIMPFEKLKTFKGMNLYRTCFSIRIDTLLGLLNDMNKEKVFDDIHVEY